MSKVIFKHEHQGNVYPKLLAAMNKLCEAYKKDAICSSGTRTIDEQKEMARITLANNKGSYQITDPKSPMYGAVYNSKGQCTAGAYGKSNHCFGLAMDMSGWVNQLTNAQLKPYGLIKPMDYEPWHVELIETRKLTESQKPAFYFQYTHGLVADGIAGPKTKAKVQEVQELINKISKGVK